jgi:hypothetical protein
LAISSSLLPRQRGKTLIVESSRQQDKKTSSTIPIEESWRNSLRVLYRITAQILGSASYRQNIAAMRES